MSNPLIEARDRFAAAHPEQRRDLNGRDWGVIDVGSGPALLLIPGTLGRADIFWNQIEALSDRLHIVAVSYPDSGGIVEWTSDMVTLMDSLDIAEACVLGSSLGGYLAQYLAGSHPQRVSRLVAANTLHSVAGLETRPPYSMDLQNGPIEELRTGFGNALSAWGQAHPEQQDLVDLLLRESGGRILEGELRARLAALKHGRPLPPCPLEPDRVFTIEADDDPLIPAEMRAAVRARLKPSVAYRFRDGGHFPYVVRPADYTALLEQVMDLDVTGPDWGTASERVR